MADPAPEDLSKEREMIEDPMKWPSAYLPLKNYSRREGGWPQIGYLVAGISHPKGDPTRTVKLGYYEDPVGEEEFADVDALLDAGWRVD